MPEKVHEKRIFQLLSNQALWFNNAILRRTGGPACISSGCMRGSAGVLPQLHVDSVDRFMQSFPVASQLKGPKGRPLPPCASLAAMQSTNLMRFWFFVCSGHGEEQ
jgi:hypothetical protein